VSESRVRLPSVRVVTITFDGADMTLRCVQSLLDHDPVLARQEIVVVDNASVDGAEWLLRRHVPSVQLRTSLTNRGFAGGCNLGMGDLASTDYVALINNDAYVEDDWLSPLVRELEVHPEAAAASPKMVIADRFRWIRVDCPDAAPFGDDSRDIGVSVCGIEMGTTESPRPLDDIVTFDEGFWWPDPGVLGRRWQRWTKHLGNIFLPLGAIAADAPRTVRLLLRAPVERTAVVTTSGGTARVIVSEEPTWHCFELGDEVVDVINNAGSALYTGGYGGDRGFLEIDRGQYDDPAEVFAWCGGAVVLRTDFLRQVGTFDERFFVYYEDTDLSWRGRHAGWTYRYVPQSVVRHEHAATSGGEQSAVFRFHVARNRVLMLTKNGPRHLVATAWRDVMRSAWRDLRRHPVLARIRRRRRSASNFDPTSLRVVMSALRLTPRMWLDRRRIRSVSRFGDASLQRWMVTK
jgi:GT2 family glycosyltransferase